MTQKKVVYIAGPMTGVEKYWEPFERAEDDLIALGYTPLSPARNPQGMTYQQYMHICIGMIHAADAVLFLTGHEASSGARVELAYCQYVEKPVVFLKEREFESLIRGKETPREVVRAWLKHDLEEVLGK